MRRDRLDDASASDSSFISAGRPLVAHLLAGQPMLMSMIWRAAAL
jgi:hypothetical protein